MFERILTWKDVLMSGDFAEDRPHETSKSLISILFFFCPAIGGAGSPWPPLATPLFAAIVNHLISFEFYICWLLWWLVHPFCGRWRG